MKLFFATLLLVFLSVPSVGYTYTGERLDEDQKYVVPEVEERHLPHQYRHPSNYAGSDSRYHRPMEGLEDQIRGAESKKLKDNIAFSFTSDFYSRYVARGQRFSEGFVWQPSATVELYGFGLSVWSNFVLDNEPNQGEWNEVDFTPYYSYRFHGLTVQPSIMFAVYPNTTPASLNYTPQKTVRPQFHLSYEFGQFDIFTDLYVYAYPDKGSVFWMIGSGFHHKFVKQFGIETSALIAIGNSKYNRKRFADVGMQFDLFQYNFALSFYIKERFIVSPEFQVSTFLPPSIRNVLTEPTQVRGGVSVRYDM